MKPYNQIDDTLKAKLQMICDEDLYGLRPQSLYNNIAYSVGDPESLANLFEVPLSLIKAIKEINHEDC
jgi:hypothetical protein